MKLRRRKPVDPEVASKRELDRTLNRLLRRSRKTVANWELFDSRNKGRTHLLNWETFRNPFHNDIEAVASVEVNNRTWWVLAKRKPEPFNFEALLTFGLLGLVFSSSGDYRIVLQFWSEDPRTLNKPTWDYLNNPDDVTRGYVRNRKELAALVG